MISRLTNVATQVAESVLGIVGVRVGTEEPAHTSKKLTDTVEIRRYEPRIAAETTVKGEEGKARNEGFRILAGYIFGKNHGGGKIAMTAPVSQESSGEKIAMTAPVSQAPSRSQKIEMTAPVSRTGGPDGWVIRFFMPSKWTMATLPQPDDDRVRLVEVPSETFAVLRFTGDRSGSAVAARSAELLQTLKANGIEPDGDTTSWFYDPPWTLPFRRRNEVVVPIRS